MACLSSPFFHCLMSILASTDPISTGGSLNFHLILNQKAKKGREGGQTAEMRAGGECEVVITLCLLWLLASSDATYKLFKS